MVLDARPAAALAQSQGGLSGVGHPGFVPLPRVNAPEAAEAVGEPDDHRDGTGGSCRARNDILRESQLYAPSGLGLPGAISWAPVLGGQ
jgi:hypothetical protein